MIDKTNLSPAAEPSAPRQGSSLSAAEAEGKRDEFREAMRQEAAIGRGAEPSAPRQSSAPSVAEGEGEGFREAMRQDAAIDRGAEPFAPRQGSVPSVAEGEGEGLREAVRQDTEKNGTSGKPGGRLGSEAEGEELAEAGRKTGARDEKAVPVPPPLFSGDALLRSLGGSYAPLETRAAAPSLAQDAPALAADLAERILVNTDNRAAGGEVRIALKDSVLPDTEIVLRQEGERLVVQLVSGNAASLGALRLAREDLQNKLLALDREVSVEVLDKQSQENGDTGHSGRRSRGLDYFPESER